MTDPSRLFVGVMTGLLVMSYGQARAQDRASSASSVPHSITDGSSPPLCIEVDIAGHRAGHLDCATQAIEKAVRDTHRRLRAEGNLSVAKSGSPDPRTGVASRAGTRLRLRENFGTSVRPPAVPMPAYANAPGRNP